MGLTGEARWLFFNTAITVVGLMRNTRAVSRIPLPLMCHVNDLAADLRYPAAVLVVEEKDPPFALPVLTPITLDPIGLLACFNDFGAMTVGTLDRDRDHRLPPRIFIMRSHRTEKLLI